MRVITHRACQPNPAVLSSGPAWRAAFDIYEDDSQFTLRADLPGLSREQIDIRVEDSTLTVSGERTVPEGEKSENYSRRERPTGKFSRRFRLPDKVNEDNISAAYDSGVLEVRLPKQEPDKRVITVQ